MTPTQRSHCMSQIRSRDTGPELAVRSIIYRMGFRFRVHQRSLPGRPDIVLPRHHKVVLVHGCFWHAHTCRPGRIQPAVNSNYWSQKRKRNQARDRRVLRKLRKLGWQVLVIWECELKNPARAKRRISRFLIDC